MTQKTNTGFMRRLISLTGAAAMFLSLILPPTAVLSAEQESRGVESNTITFDAAADKQKFSCYSSSMGSFSVKNGMLAPNGASGEMKAIYKDDGAVFQSVSVELHPGTQGINGGLYINASAPAHGREKITSLGVMVESNHSGWEDAPNRVDLIVCEFPGWTEHQRTISETGAGNALFTGGEKQPLLLKVDISMNVLTITLSLLSDPAKFITTTYTHTSGVDLSLGDVGIRSDKCNGTFDNFTTEIAVAAEPEPEPEPSEPTEPAEPVKPTDLVDFESAESGDKFQFYHSSTGGFAVQDGKLVTTGAEGEFKAIYQDTNASFQSVSVDIYPGSQGINGGLYLDVTDAADPANQITGLVVMVESNMSGWADAVNRADIVVGAFPQWKELHRTITETGNGNALFAGEKAPVNLTVSIQGNTLTITLKRLDDPTRAVTTTCVCQGYTDIALGNVGIRSQFNNASYDNFSVIYQTVAEDKESDPVAAPDPMVPTDLVDFETADSADKFDFYHSSANGFTVQDGKLVATAADGEFKAIYKDTNASFRGVSVDIYPGVTGINSGLYLDVTEAGNPANQITGLVVMAESHFTGWEDAVNRLDLVVGQFPTWTELHRVITETGNGNALFAGEKAPVNLTVTIEGNTLTIILRRLDDPQRFVTTTYVCEGFENIALGNVGIRSQFTGASYDNFAVAYDTVAEDKEPDVVDPTPDPEPEPDPIVPTDLVDFESAESGDQFKFYHSTAGGFAVQDGKLVPTGELGEFKAIYKDTNASFQYVSVDIYPDETGINSGLYLDVTEAGHHQNQITGLAVMVESNMEGWDDAVNRADLVVGQFPTWAEMHRVISETGAGNALFMGEKAPVNLSVAIEGNTLTITLRRVDDPRQMVTTTYVCEGYENIALGNVGIRSQVNSAAFDNFAVVYETVAEDKESDVVEPEPDPIVPTDLVDFETAASGDKFKFYHSTTGGFAVKDGKLVPTGELGEFKAIYKDTNASFQYVSVDIYPDETGINSGLYLDVTQAGNRQNQITGLAIMVESNMEGWDDAVNRADLVVGQFPTWTEMHRVISETGAGNALFMGEKAPVNLSVAIEGNTLTITLRRVDDPRQMVTTTYVCEGYENIALGNVGIRSQVNSAAFDNFAVVYETVAEDKESDVVEPEFVPTELIDFDGQGDAKRFDIYRSSKGNLTVKNGKLTPTGEEGEFKAIYKDGGATIKTVSVDLYPGASGQINSGLYIGTSTVENGADRIKGLCVMVESNMTGWDDAVNRIDIVVGRFPIWKELYRYTSETGAGNALFAGAKEPVNLRVDLDGNTMTITLSLVSDPSVQVSTVYTYGGATPLPRHNVGLRSAFNDVSFDNFAVVTTAGSSKKTVDTKVTTLEGAKSTEVYYNSDEEKQLQKRLRQILDEE